ncbi:hypothetical protein B0H13DRAFT_1866891 [Mycena leptocephala]|nr:hypothetical protein B0H13DRAFT_1866891 [Mycena leptocephala]
MGPRAHNDDDASSNSSASVRSSNHNDNEPPKSRIGTYRGRPYYVLDEEGLPYDPWYDLRSSKTLPLLQLLADGDRFDALSKTSDGKAEIADLFIKNLPPLDMHFTRWKGVDQPKEVWMILYHIRSLLRRLSTEQSAMYTPRYGWFKPQSNAEYQHLYAGPDWEIPSELLRSDDGAESLLGLSLDRATLLSDFYILPEGYPRFWQYRLHAFVHGIMYCSGTW